MYSEYIASLHLFNPYSTRGWFIFAKDLPSIMVLYALGHEGNGSLESQAGTFLLQLGRKKTNFERISFKMPGIWFGAAEFLKMILLWPGSFHMKYISWLDR